MFCVICKLFLSVAGVLAYLQPQWKQEEITFLQSIRQGKILTTFSSGAAGHCDLSALLKGPNTEQKQSLLVAIPFNDQSVGVSALSALKHR